jgi:DNA-binding transcriptional regulator YiaG
MHDQLTLRGTSGTPVQTAPVLPALQDHPRSVPAAAQSAPMREWIGRDAVALRKALRMTEAKFARMVGVSARTVANWHTSPATVPRNDAQDMLDELLNAAGPSVRERFERFAGHQPEPGAVPTGGLAALVEGARDAVAARESRGQVISLGSHPRYAADFKPLACGQVAAARTALGLTHAEFAALLGGALGWTVMPETVGRWERESVPPGDVVLFCQAYLTGALGGSQAAPDGGTGPQRDDLTARRAARGHQ